MSLTEIDQNLVRDAKARQYAEVAGRGVHARDRANARRWLRRNGYGPEHLGDPEPPVNLVTEAERRLPPADPTGIYLRYLHEHHWASSGDDGPEIWHVVAVVPDAEDDEGQPAESHVGEIEIVLVDPHRPDAFGVLDGHDADLGYIGEVVLNPGSRGLDPALADRLECFGTRLLILNSVRLAPQWRGFGIGVLLAGLAMQRLSGGCMAAVCHPAPLADADEDEDPAREAAAGQKLAEVWPQLGFEHFRDGIYVIDLARVTLGDALKQLRGRLASHY